MSDMTRILATTIITHSSTKNNNNHQHYNNNNNNDSAISIACIGKVGQALAADGILSASSLRGKVPQRLRSCPHSMKLNTASENPKINYFPYAQSSHGCSLFPHLTVALQLAMTSENARSLATNDISLHKIPAIDFCRRLKNRF